MDKAKKDSLSQLAVTLGLLLVSPNGLTQKKIAQKAGVDQGLVSRIKNRRVVRETDRILALKRVIESEYANMRNVITPTPREVDTAIVGYLASGGDAELLVRQVELLRAAHARQPRHRNVEQGSMKRRR